jgi:protein-disulfide isomerase
MNCIEKDSSARQAVDRDFAAALRLSLSGTPSVVVNGMLLPGTPSDTAIARAIARGK